jgi:hypothetical protein
MPFCEMHCVLGGCHEQVGVRTVPEGVHRAWVLLGQALEKFQLTLDSLTVVAASSGGAGFL